MADTVIATAAIAGVTAPVYGAPPVLTIAATTEYAATISWNTNPERFAASTVYTATITITPKTGYTLTGVSANFFTVAGATVTNDANAGIVSAVFPATGATLREATHADFNAASRQISVKLEIYFDGITNTPLTVDNSNYLVGADWLEECSAESKEIIGSPSSNELTFRLYNPDGIFSPTNVSGTYYGLMKRGIPVKLFIRPESATETINWLQLGLYYVSDWTAEITNIYVDVVANDIWLDIFSTTVPNYAVTTNKTVKYTLERIFTLMGYTVNASATLTRILAYSYIKGDPLEFLASFMQSDFITLETNNVGAPIIGTFLGNKTSVATLTDSDQVVSVQSIETINKSYNGASVTYYEPFVSPETFTVLTIPNINLVLGLNQLFNMYYDTGPLISLYYFGLWPTDEGGHGMPELFGYICNAWEFSVQYISYYNGIAPYQFVIQARAYTPKKSIISDTATALCTTESIYIQSRAYATTVKDILNAYVAADIPYLTMNTRGDPLIKINNRILVESTKYDLNYDGITQRLQYHYNGSLSCVVSLLNYSLFGGA